MPAGRGPVMLLSSAFDGAIDEIAVYTTALNNDTVFQHYHATIGSHQPYPPKNVPAPKAPPPAPATGENTSLQLLLKLLKRADYKGATYNKNQL